MLRNGEYTLIVDLNKIITRSLRVELIIFINLQVICNYLRLDRYLFELRKSSFTRQFWRYIVKGHIHIIYID